MSHERTEGPAPHEVYTALLAHELRTPTTIILGYLQLLEDEALLEDPDNLRKYLAAVRGKAVELARIVTELTNFAELAEGQRPTSGPMTPTTPGALIRLLIGDRPARLEVSPEAAVAAVDVERLGLGLRQLLENAYRFGTPGVPVLVGAMLGGAPPRLVVRVTNEGEPIPAGLREMIFEPFRQGEDYGTRRHGGLGLGLTVARRATEGAGGRLELEPGAPTTFRLELPIREDAVAQQARLLHERAESAGAQALRAIEDVRALHAAVLREREARGLLEAQLHRTADDLEAARDQAEALARRLDDACRAAEEARSD